MSNRFLLELEGINELEEAWQDSVLSDRAIDLYANLNLDVIREALVIAASRQSEEKAL